MAKEFNISAVFSIKDHFTAPFQKMKETVSSFKSSISQATEPVDKMKNAIDKIRNSTNNATSGLKNMVSNGFQKVKSTVVGASSSITKFNAALKGNTITNAIGNLKKLAAAYIGVKSASSLFKTAMGSATEFQNYRNTLNTVMKDTNAAAETFKQYTDYANKTPWTEGEVVSAGVKLKSYGLEGSLEQIQKISDMSAVMNKSLDQGVEAIADAETGELERLKEFGVTKQQITDMAKSMGKDVVNNKGQITDQSGFNDAMFAVMKEKFDGGTDNMAKTFTGRMSTIKGSFQKTLASIIGVSDDGTVKVGSAFDTISNRLEDVISVLQNFAANGGAEKVGEIVSNAFKKASEAIDFCKAHMDEIKSISKAVLTGFIAFKSISGVFSVFNGISSAITGYSNFKSKLKDIGFIDKVINGYTKFNGASGKLLKTLGSILNPINMVKGAFNGLSNVVKLIPRGFTLLKNSITSIPGLLKNLGSAGIGGIKTLFTGITHPISSFKLIKTAAKGAFSVLKSGFMGIFSPATIVIAIMAVIVAAVIHLWKTNSEFREHIKAVWNQIKQAISKAATAIGQIINSIKAWLDKHQAEVQAFKMALGAIWDGICAVVKVAIELIADTIGGVVKVFADVIQLIADLMNGDWSKAWDDFKQIVNDAIKIVKDWWQDLKDFFFKNPVSLWVQKKFSGDKSKDNEPDAPADDEESTGENASGTSDWRGGWTWVGEHGRELMKLPKGTQIKSNSESESVVNNSTNNSGSVSISIPKLADSIIIREDADIDKIADAFARKIKIQTMKMPEGGTA